MRNSVAKRGKGDDLGRATGYGKPKVARDRGRDRQDEDNRGCEGVVLENQQRSQTTTLQSLNGHMTATGNLASAGEAARRHRRGDSSPKRGLGVAERWMGRGGDGVA